MGAELVWSHKICSIEESKGMPDPDVQHMLRFKEGDMAAFDLLFSRYTRPVINFAFRFVRNRELAEELAQEIFLRVYEGAKTYQPKTRFAPWLYRIATNVCLNEIRKPQFRAKQQSLTRDEDSSDMIPSRDLQINEEPTKDLERQAIARALKLSLDQLPDKQRTAFILNKYQELSYAEVAESMKLGEKAVKSLIHRAKETLAAKLAPLLPGL
jgi:RNA polymerase sigma-70 factor (ECF subfamily)